MRKYGIIIMVLMLAFSVVMFTACEDGDDGEVLKITFESNGGTTIPDLEKAIGKIIKEPVPPTREGYTFTGWFSDEKLTHKFTFDKMPKKGITLYAKWEVNEYTITFNSNGGSSR